MTPIMQHTLVHIEFPVSLGYPVYTLSAQAFLQLVLGSFLKLVHLLECEQALEMLGNY